MAEFPIQVECAARLFGKLATAMFAGGSLCLNHVSHPAIVSSADKECVHAFIEMYKRSKKTQFSNLFTAFVCNGLVYYFHRDEKNLLYSTAVLLTLLPYTKLAMIPINLAILSVPEKAEKADFGEQDAIYKEGKENIKLWGNLHWVRSIISIAALSLLIC